MGARKDEHKITSRTEHTFDFAHQIRDEYPSVKLIDGLVPPERPYWIDWP